jgi:hypothetical protein
MAFGKRFAICGLGLLCAGWMLAQGRETFKARLSAVPADARTRPELAGLGSATATLSGSKLTVTGSFDGLLSPATTAELHAGVLAGVRGPVVAELTISKATSGSLSGTADLNAEQVDRAKKDGLYIQIQSEKAPEGVIWGWLLKEGK